MSGPQLDKFERFNLTQDGQGNNSAANVTPVQLLVNGITPLSQFDSLPVTTEWQLNSLASATDQMLIGTTHLYESDNNGDTLTEIMEDGQALTFAGAVTAIAYGGTSADVANPAIAYVGDSTGDVKLRTEAGGPFTDIAPTTSIDSAGVTLTDDLVGPVDGIAVDPQDWTHVVVISPTQVFYGVTDDSDPANPVTTWSD